MLLSWLQLRKGLLVADVALLALQPVYPGFKSFPAYFDSIASAKAPVEGAYFQLQQAVKLDDLRKKI